MITRQTLRQNRQAILEITQRYGARDVRVFGSVAWDESMEAADVDILVRFEPRHSQPDREGLTGDLETLLGVKVEVIDADGMHPRLRTVVEKEALPL